MPSAPPRIISLDPSSIPLIDQLSAGLIGSKDLIVPGDEAWAYRRKISTMCAYDTEGLKLYEKITTDCPSYYLFQAELSLLQKYSSEITSILFPAPDFATGSAATDDEVVVDDAESQQNYQAPSPGSKAFKLKVADWGSESVGRWNEGVNGEDGMKGRGRSFNRKDDNIPPSGTSTSALFSDVGCGIDQEKEVPLFDIGHSRGTILELGAGSLSKTRHLLKSIKPSPTSIKKAIYLALDLSYDELERTLIDLGEELTSSGGEEAVEVGGVHSTFDEGLDWIRNGSPMTPSSASSVSSSPRLASAIKANNQKAPTSNEDESPPPFTHSTLPDTPPRSPSPPKLQQSIPVSDDGSVATMDISAAPTPPTHILFLGSSLGNFSRSDAVEFLKSLPLSAEEQGGPGGKLVLGLDSRNEKSVVELAYNDPAGVTRDWAMNALKVAAAELESHGGTGLVGSSDGFEYEGRYNVEEGRHEAYFRSLVDQTITLPSSTSTEVEKVNIEKGELLNFEWSYKYSLEEAMELFNKSNLRPITRYVDPSNGYSIWVLERPSLHFGTIDSSHTLIKEKVDIKSQTKESAAIEKKKSPYGVPSLEDWEQLWKYWDEVTLQMIPKEKLMERWIDLRNKNLFYLGHIPTFLDIHLSRLLKESHTEPEHFKDIFERGIDPNVDDPTIIHSHSTVPENDCDWPSLTSIIEFRDAVRRRLRKLYADIDSGVIQLSRSVGRVLFMTFEHEAYHVETLLYMILQAPCTTKSSVIRPPLGFTPPHWNSLKILWDQQYARDLREVSTVTFEPTTISIGHDDVERDDAKYPTAESWNVDDHQFGWDNESPAQHKVSVGKFKVERKPISNGDFLKFVKRSGVSEMPSSWVEVEGEWKVRTLYGPVDFSIAQHWPVMASYDELNAYAKSVGGRIPNEAELRVFMTSPDGVQVDSSSSNVGLKNWHPVPAQLSTSSLPGHNGGVWEWTSTPFGGLDGFVPSDIYPGYSSDFFDGHHHVVLGGSCLTIPRQASRNSLRNTYQHNYRFAWVGGRVCYNL